MAKIDELVEEIAALSPVEQERLFERLAALALRRGMQKLSDMYRERLRHEGKLDQSVEDIWQELRRIRDEVAARDNPD